MMISKLRGHSGQPNLPITSMKHPRNSMCVGKQCLDRCLIPFYAARTVVTMTLTGHRVRDWPSAFYLKHSAFIVELTEQICFASLIECHLRSFPETMTHSTPCNDLSWLLYMLCVNFSQVSKPLNLSCEPVRSARYLSRDSKVSTPLPVS